MQNYTRKTLKLYWQHTKKYKFSGLLIFFAMIGTGIMNTIIPLFFKKFFDTLTSGDPKDVIFSALISILIMIFVLEMIQWTTTVLR